MVGAARRQGAGAGGGQAADRGQPSRRPCAVAAAGRSGPRLSLSAAARLGRPLPVARSARGRRLSPAGDDHRRCRRRGVRQGGQAARPAPIPAARRSRRWPRDGDPKAVPLPRPLVGSAEPHFSFAGLKSAVQRAVAVGRAPARRTSPPASSRRWSTAWSTAPRARLQRSDAPALVVAGGVAANRAVRTALAAAGRGERPPLHACRRAGCAPTMRR